MIGNMKYLITLFLLICFYLKGVINIKCYQCSSADDSDGEDNCGAYETFHEERHVAVECNSEDSHSPGTFCMKITEQGPRGFIWDGRWRQVIRQCASVAETGVPGVCNWGIRENGVYWEKCYCSEDGCNGATVDSLHTILFIVPIALIGVRYL